MLIIVLTIPVAVPVALILYSPPVRVQSVIPIPVFSVVVAVATISTFGESSTLTFLIPTVKPVPEIVPVMFSNHVSSIPAPVELLADIVPDTFFIVP